MIFILFFLLVGFKAEKYSHKGTKTQSFTKHTLYFFNLGFLCDLVAEILDTKPKFKKKTLSKR